MGASIVPKLAKDTMVRGGASPQHVLSDVSVGSKADLTAPRPTSAIPPKADIDGRYRHVRFCQKRTSAHPKGRGMKQPYSITSSARASNADGTVRPRAFAVFRLMTSSYLLGACTGISLGFSPLRMRST